jgi:hypothetical protein
VVLVSIGLVGAWLAYQALAESERSGRIERVERDLRLRWSRIDVEQIEADYLAAVVGRGPPRSLPGLPDIDGARFERADFGDGTIDIVLRVDGDLSATSCVEATVQADRPDNTITVRRVEC